MALLILPVLYLGLKRHCGTLVYGVTCDGNGVPRYGQQFKEGEVAHLCGQPLFSYLSFFCFFLLLKFNQAAIICLGSERKLKDVVLSWFFLDT